MDLPINYEKSHWTVRRDARNQYVLEQEGMCHHCGSALDCAPSKEVDQAKIDWRLFPPNFTRHPVHLHHCQKTGMSIGAVHAKCNAYLWQFMGE